MSVETSDSPAAPSGGLRARQAGGPFQTVWRNRELIRAAVRRDITQPYAGQILGARWVVVQPLFLVVLLTVVFNFLFKSKVGGDIDIKRDYTTFILCGLVPWQVFILSLARASVDVIGSANLVKQVVFPVQILPAKGVFASLPTMGIGLLFLLGYELVVFHSLPVTAILLPVVIAMQVVWMLGCAFLLSSVAVFFRDLKDVVNLFVTASVYLLPIVYLPGFTPKPLRHVVRFNPFSNLIWCYQDSLLYGEIRHPIAWVATAVLALVSIYVGFAVFQRLRPHMGNVL